MFQRSAGSCTGCTRANAFPLLCCSNCVTNNQQSTKEHNKEHSWECVLRCKFSRTMTFDRIKNGQNTLLCTVPGQKRKKKWHAAALAFTPLPLLWKMVGFLMVSVWNKTDIWAFISHKRTGKIRLENNNKCRNLERLKWRPFFFIPHSFGVPAAAATTKTTACTKLTYVSYTTRLKLTSFPYYRGFHLYLFPFNFPFIYISI